MKIGYARVSTDEQSLNMQLRALRRVGCGKIFQDKFSGADFNRPGLDRTLKALKSGDMLVVWKLDRLGHTLMHFVGARNTLSERKIRFCSLSENIDTATPGGRLVFHIMSALAEFELALLGERTCEGLAAATETGREDGKAEGASISKTCAPACMLARALNTCTRPNVGRSTLYRALRKP